jgi:hypothetical protein
VARAGHDLTSYLGLAIQENSPPRPICSCEKPGLGFRWSEIMSKREIIDFIIEINRGAKPEFLAQFPAEELDLYLEHLMELDLEEIVMCA